MYSVGASLFFFALSISCFVVCWICETRSLSAFCTIGVIRPDPVSTAKEMPMASDTRTLPLGSSQKDLDSGMPLLVIATALMKRSLSVIFSGSSAFSSSLNLSSLSTRSLTVR